MRSAGALVAFGGYNGKYHNSVQVYRPGERPAPFHALFCLANDNQKLSQGVTLRAVAVTTFPCMRSGHL